MYFRHHQTWRRFFGAISIVVGLLLSEGAVSVTALQVDVTVDSGSRPQCHFSRNIARFDGCWHGLVADMATTALRRDSSIAFILVDVGAASDEKPGIEARRAANAWSYLVNNKDIDPARIVLRWHRAPRTELGKRAGTMRIIVIRAGERIPDLIEDDIAWSADSR